MSTKLPYLPLYPADYLADTSHLTLQEHGAYLLLIFALWQRGGELRDGISRLPNVLGISQREWNTVSIEVMKFFNVEDGVISNNRITYELDKVKEKSEKAKESISKRWSNEPKKEYERITNVLRTLYSPDSESDTDTKGIRERKKYNILADGSDEIYLAKKLYSEHLKHDEKYLHGHNLDKTFQTWGQDINKLIRIDGRSLDQIESVIVYAQNSDFWRSNILSGKKLREKFSQLFSQLATAPKSKSANLPISVRHCPNQECNQPVYGSLSFCTACGTDMNPKGDF